jgi:hypothetical protein
LDWVLAHAEAAGDQLERARIGRDVPRCPDSRAAGLHHLVHDDLVLLERHAPLGDRADVAHEPEHRQHDVGLELARRLALDVLEHDVREALPFGVLDDVDELVKGEQRRPPRRDLAVELRHRRAMSAESVAAMHERHVRRDPG